MSFSEAILDGITLHHPTFTPEQKKDRIRIWRSIIAERGISEEVAAMAFRKVLGESLFMPKPAEVLQVIQGTKTEQAEYAWAKVVQAAQHKGSPYYPVQFDDARIHEALHSLGGWPKFYESYWYNHNSNEPWAKKNFLDAYNSSRGLDPKPLAGRGINDADLTPLLIGDKIKAAKILPQVNSELKQLAKNKELA